VETERWQQIDRLYHSALEQAGNRRAAFLAEACRGDESLQAEVESLLAQEQDDKGFLESPALDLAARDLAGSSDPGPQSHPAAIGRYRIVRLLGEGGMGTVYEARQDEPCRLVALKVVKLGLATQDRLRRFRRESQALARLQHPGIAQIYDSGTADTASGPQPYFAMEFIHGLPLKQYAEEHQLNTRQRLVLMVKICDAVHHAHQRGLIHRDLKPGNIIVNETGQPKILDFGVARVTQVDAEDADAQATMQTGLGQIVGTLAYMSPEQVSGDPLEVDTRTDVYSLGVILYELLSQRLPYEVNPRQLPEAVQRIREEEPTSLSAITRDFRGDIETIARKALEKDKTRRYTSAADLGADIQRYLNDEPVAARPPSAGYQLKKFARRHRGLVAGVAAIFVVLLAGVTVSTSMAVRARRAEAQALAVNEFLQDDLLAQAGSRAQAGPGTKPDPELKVRTALDRASSRVAQKFGGQPLVEASIRQTIGKSYIDLGLYPDAQKHLERSLDLRRRLLGEDQPETLSVMNDLGLLYRFAGKPAQAEALLSKVLEIRLRVSGEEQPATLRAMNNLGFVYQIEGKYSQAGAILSKALEIRRRVLGDEHPETLIATDNLAIVYFRKKEYAKAESLFAKNLENRRRVIGEEHPDTLDTMNNLGATLKEEGRLAEAVALLSKVLEAKRRVLGEEHPSTLTSMVNVAVLYAYQGQYLEAEPLMVRAVELQGRMLAEEHPDRLGSMRRLAALYSDEGKYGEAEAFFTRALKGQRRALGEVHPDTLSSLGGLGRLQLRQHKYLEAESTLRIALRGYEKIMPESWERYECQSMLGGSLDGQKKYAEAEPLLISGYEGLMQRGEAMLLQNRRFLSESGERIVQLYKNWGKPEMAASWQAKLPSK
jgi:eukaryotic-like serine/threonine-protein kinase